MSTLNCRPVAQVFLIEGELRKCLMKRLWPEAKFSTPQYIDQTWKPYLLALADADIKGAAILLEELTKYDRLMFDIES